MNYKLILAEFGLGAEDINTKMGPGKFIESEFYDRRFEDIITVNDYFSVNNCPFDESRLNHVVRYCKQLAQITHNVSQNDIPVILGGDHSIAIGTWSGIIKALDAKNDFGLVWIDAHLDAFDKNCMPPNGYHGMTAAALLNCGAQDLNNIMDYSSKLNPKYLVYIGCRKFSDDEYALVRSLGATIFDISYVEQKGLGAVMQEALSIVTKAKYFGMTIDLDGFDPTLVPGVGIKESNGLKVEPFINSISSIVSDTKFRGLEIVEFYPHNDENHKTYKVIAQILDQVPK